MPSTQLQLPWLLFPFLFVGLWVFASAQISREGWRSFAERYPASSRPAGSAHNSPRTRFASFISRYGNVVRVIFTADGVYFSVLFLFRPFHSPFLVPWDSVKRIEKKRGFLFDHYQLDIEDAAGEIHVTLPLSVEHDLFRYKNAASYEGSSVKG